MILFRMKDNFSFLPQKVEHDNTELRIWSAALLSLHHPQCFPDICSEKSKQFVYNRHFPFISAIHYKPQFSMPIPTGFTGYRMSSAILWGLKV